MTEIKAPAATKQAKALLALNPKEEAEFKKKVQEVKKRPNKFDYDDVAQIVAETMNNYLMGERLIKCHLVPAEKVHEKLFVGSQRAFKKPMQPAVARYNKRHTPEEVKEMTGRLLHKESKLRKRLSEKGIDYDFPGFDVTPVCTPSVLDKRRSMKINDDDSDDEIIIKNTPALKKV
ncbi:unnamed protein product [Coregonus sp. 'balchen']|nr:unnamed protein product [Coregonus sp. 'balchen']